MIRIKQALLAMVAVLVLGTVAFSATAADADQGTVVAHFKVRRTNLPVYQVAVLEADNTPQGMDGFAEYVAPVLHAWTRDHFGSEAIGNICHTPDGSRWGVLVLTIYAHTSSPRTQACPAGMVLAGADIHSHPQKTRYLANGVDRLFLHVGLDRDNQVGTVPDQYSPDDLNAGPGYLVGGVVLHFQDGHGNERIVAQLVR